ncbi:MULTISPECIES: type II secretion system F family protein [Pseudomonas]|uniref:type II secretion system F family protein n=1 Tax=Pseudomonas TaxID=286 RepID=UPI001238CD9E|nr:MULTISPECIES: type II secretion system F family protein [Pseudomonas]QIB52920.1 type II secretion system F family protein [Pseudomonas sp. OIL-1]
MADVYLCAAVAASLAALWIAIALAPKWSLRADIDARLRNRSAKNGKPAASWLGRFAQWFTTRAAIRSDFRELESALDITGRNEQQIHTLYLTLCWLMPALAFVLGFVFWGVTGGAVLAMAGFLLPRRVVRAMGGRAEMQQNLESIELCHMTRMLMEAGLSIERAVRLAALQGRQVMPHLATRLDRFNRVIASGADRTAALDELGRNRRIPVLRQYASLMKQSGTLGAGVSLSLDQIINEALHAERSRLKEATGRTGAKMTVIMMAFMLPALFILIGGPAVISVAASLGR